MALAGFPTVGGINVAPPLGGCKKEDRRRHHLPTPQTPLLNFACDVASHEHRGRGGAQFIPFGGGLQKRNFDHSNGCAHKEKFKKGG